MYTAERNTRDQILATAERLFAQRGVDQTSVRQINQAAGQRNSSATRYHFGSKTNLINAIIERRTATIDERRQSLLAGIPVTCDVHDLVTALVVPFAEHLTREAECYYYIALAAQINEHPVYSEIARGHFEHGESLKRLRRLIAAELQHLPNFIVLQRFSMALRQVISELADLQRSINASPTGTRSDAALFVSDLIDSVSAGLQAAWSKETSDEHARLSRRMA